MSHVSGSFRFLRTRPVRLTQVMQPQEAGKNGAGPGGDKVRSFLGKPGTEREVTGREGQVRSNRGALLAVGARFSGALEWRASWG